MTEKQHIELYEEIKPVLYSRTGVDKLTPAQKMFVESFEIASFDDNFLASYADLVNRKPGISLRNLHAFCLGYALAQSFNTHINLDDNNKTNH